MAFPCTECPEELGSKTEWEDHINRHTFAVTFWCPRCFDPIENSNTFPAKAHLYLKHKADLDTAQRDGEDANNFTCPWVGKIWCRYCKEIKHIGGTAPDGHISPAAVEHLASHLPK
jgi:hypothetical protein